MTRKDYTKAARIVRELEVNGPVTMVCRKEVIAAFIRLFTDDGALSLFDVNKFREACEQ